MVSADCIYTYIMQIPKCRYKTMFKEEVMDLRGSSGGMGSISEERRRGRDVRNTVFMCEIMCEILK